MSDGDSSQPSSQEKSQDDDVEFQLDDDIADTTTRPWWKPAQLHKLQDMYPDMTFAHATFHLDHAGGADRLDEELLAHEAGRCGPFSVQRPLSGSSGTHQLATSSGAQQGDPYKTQHHVDGELARLLSNVAFLCAAANYDKDALAQARAAFARDTAALSKRGPSGGGGLCGSRLLVTSVAWQRDFLDSGDDFFSPDIDARTALNRQWDAEGHPAGPRQRQARADAAAAAQQKHGSMMTMSGDDNGDDLLPAGTRRVRDSTAVEEHLDVDDSFVDAAGVDEPVVDRTEQKGEDLAVDREDSDDESDEPGPDGDGEDDAAPHVQPVIQSLRVVYNREQITIDDPHVLTRKDAADHSPRGIFICAVKMLYITHLRNPAARAAYSDKVWGVDAVQLDAAGQVSGISDEHIDERRRRIEAALEFERILRSCSAVFDDDLKRYRRPTVEDGERAQLVPILAELRTYFYVYYDPKQRHTMLVWTAEAELHGFLAGAPVRRGECRPEQVAGGLVKRVAIYGVFFRLALGYDSVAADASHLTHIREVCAPQCMCLESHADNLSRGSCHAQNCACARGVEGQCQLPGYQVRKGTAAELRAKTYLPQGLYLPDSLLREQGGDFRRFPCVLDGVTHILSMAEFILWVGPTSSATSSVFYSKQRVFAAVKKFAQQFGTEAFFDDDGPFTQQLSTFMSSVRPTGGALTCGVDPVMRRITRESHPTLHVALCKWQRVQVATLRSRTPSTCSTRYSAVSPMRTSSSASCR
jgi:hypothetical protein